MKNLKRIALCIMALILVLLCCGCSSLMQAFENEELRNHTDVMLNAILMEDSDAAYSLVSDICAKSEFEPIFDEMCDLLDGTESYELKLISINQKSGYDNGRRVDTIDSAYEMTAHGKRYVISVQKNSSYQKLSSFYITPYEKTNLYYTGVVENMKDASLLQWFMILSNLVVVALMIMATVDCCRKKIKLKPLWIILILLGALSVGATVSASSFNFNFNFIWIAAYTAFVRYGGGQVTVRFVIPWGVALYFILRRWLIKKAEDVILAEDTKVQNAEVIEEQFPEE